MSSNQPINNNEEQTQGPPNGATAKKVITADKVRSALMERDDMMMNEGAAGAAQYEEAYLGPPTRIGGSNLVYNNSNNLILNHQ